MTDNTMTSIGDSVEVDADALHRYRQAREQIATWTEIADQARARLEQQLGERQTGTVDGLPVIRWARVKSTRLDQTLVKSLHPGVHAECQTTSESRRFTVVSANEATS